MNFNLMFPLQVRHRARRGRGLRGRHPGQGQAPQDPDPAALLPQRALQGQQLHVRRHEEARLAEHLEVFRRLL